MHEATLGLLMIIVAGVMNGSFAVPMKLRTAGNGSTPG